MNQKINEIENLSLDIFNVSSILVDLIKKHDNNEVIVKFRPLLEILYTKANEMCLKTGELQKEI